ncbi:MAG: YciI family protein [Gammaproteobacteria bacterium]|nr:YciI family protein [Gammaproteobacteria bacterium]
MSPLQSILAAMFFAIALAGTPSPTQAQEAPKVQQYVYVLRVAPAFHDQAKWTQADNDAVSRHFARLAAAAKAGQVIFAGRTTEPLDTTFGLVVFEAASDEAARQFMESDPAVVAGVMSATLHPYALALQRTP